jgi:hypothetical protein
MGKGPGLGKGTGQGPIPPKAGGDSAPGKKRKVPRIGHADVQIKRADDFAHDGPNGEMGKHFEPAGRMIVPAQIQQALQPEDHRQSGGHQQQVIEMGMQERPKPLRMGMEKPAKMRADEQTVEGVSGECQDEQPVMQITKTSHSVSQRQQNKSGRNGQQCLKKQNHRMILAERGIPASLNFMACFQNLMMKENGSFPVRAEGSTRGRVELRPRAGAVPKPFENTS